MTPQPGDFGLVAIPGRVGRLVRIGQWLNKDGYTDYEHAFVVVENNMLVEAEPGGARVRPLSEYDGTNVTYSEWLLSDDQRAEIVGCALGLVGTPYSVLDYLSLALVRLHVRPEWVAKYVASTKHMICSQLVDFCYSDADVQLFDDHRLPGDVTPGDLYKVLHSQRKG
jgi:uncharacterized protein YycO